MLVKIKLETEQDKFDPKELMDSSVLDVSNHVVRVR